jgi:hypothetical protein
LAGFLKVNVKISLFTMLLKEGNSVIFFITLLFTPMEICMKKAKSIAIFTILALLYGCRNNNNGNPDAELQSLKTDSLPAETRDLGFYPLTHGSHWRHIHSDFSPQGFMTKVLGDTIINGSTYAQIAELDMQGEPILARDNYRKSNDTVFAIMNGDSTEKIFLIERVGATWTQPGGQDKYQFKESFSVLEMQPLRVVNGKDYEDVLHVRCKTYRRNDNEPLYEHDMYYARNIGMIEEKRTMDQTIRLKEYEIK